MIGISFKKIKRRNVYITYKNKISNFIKNKYPSLKYSDDEYQYVTHYYYNLTSIKVDQEFLKYYKIIRKELFQDIMIDFIKNNFKLSKNKYIAMYIDTTMFTYPHPINFNNIDSYYAGFLDFCPDDTIAYSPNPTYASFTIFLPQMFTNEDFYKSIQFFYIIDNENNHNVFFNELYFENYDCAKIYQMLNISRKNINEFLVEYNYYINNNTSLLFDYKKERK